MNVLVVLVFECMVDSFNTRHPKLFWYYNMSVSFLDTVMVQVNKWLMIHISHLMIIITMAYKMTDKYFQNDQKIHGRPIIHSSIYCIKVIERIYFISDTHSAEYIWQWMLPNNCMTIIILIITTIIIIMIMIMIVMTIIVIIIIIIIIIIIMIILMIAMIMEMMMMIIMIMMIIIMMIMMMIIK